MRGGGATWLAEARAGNKGLQDLGLCCNRIGAEGAGKLAESLVSHTALMSLHLENNFLGAHKMVELLSVNFTLAEL